MRDHDNSLSRERWTGGIDEMEEDDFEKTLQSSKHKSKDKSKSGHRDDKDHKSKDREREKTSHASKDREKESKEVDKDHFSRREGRKDDKDELEREKNRDRVQDRDTDRDYFKDRERDRKDRSKEKDRERDRDGDWEIDPDRVRDKDRRKDKTREKEREKDRDRNREREIEIDHDRSRNVSEKDKIKERTREKEKEKDKEYDRNDDKPRDKDVRSHKQRDESHERSRDSKLNDKSRTVGDTDQDVSKQARGSKDAEDESVAHQTQHTSNDERAKSHGSAKELEDRIQKMKEERLKKKSETASEVEAWVNRSRKLEKGRVLDLSKKFEEQDDVNEEDNDDGDDNPTHHTNHDLSGVKVLHGIDKVLEGGAVVLTLKDQSILGAGGVNEDLDELENIEIGEQKKRDDAYKDAKKKKGLYDDKFLDEPGSEKKMLPQYDDPVADEGITLDASGRFTGEAEKKLEELRKRIQGVPASRNFEDLNAPGRLLSDYYTPDEMLKFQKPKKKKSLRKKEKLDVDALEAEAVSSGLGVGDLGSRNDSNLQALKELRERSEAEIRSSAYQAALAKADEASKTLRLGQIPLAESEEVDAPAIGDDDEEMQRSLARARRIALTKQEEAVKSGPQALALLASSTTNESGAENQNSAGAESQEKKIVFTEMEGFFLALQQDEARAPDGKDVFMEEDDVPNTSEKEAKEEDSVWSEVKESVKVELPEKKEEEISPDETIHEVAVGKGLAGALKLLKDRGALKESVEWGGRNMDKKKSKLAGIYDEEPKDKKKSKLPGIGEEPKEIHIERTDEYGRILTPKESFRLLSHKFHGKGPGKMKQEKRMRQYEEELKVKQMANSDTPTHSVERMREAQAQQKSPYIVLSGHVKPGQNSDPRSGFATVEKDFPGSLTPMLGDKKVEYLLGKRKPGAGDTGSQKKPKT